ncbi:hypothetical protein [Flavobacterium sp.]|uniref:hypothetical protein n=1 Tax=Flavobacterium sp. TaxID=239 RepID=UPI002FD91163
MKKRLEAELISIAHRILKLKNKSEVDQLYKETQKLYETLAVLKFYQDNFESVKGDVADDVLEEKIAQHLEEEAPKEVVFEAKEEAAAPTVEVEATPEPETEPEVVEEATEEEEEELELEIAPETDEKEALAFEPIFELEVEDETEVVEEAEEETEEEEIEPAETVTEFTPETKKVVIEEFLGESYVDPVFVKPNEVSLFSTEATETTQESEAKPASLNATFSKSIEIGLNDRIAFVNNLFAESNEDFNRVISQLNTFDSFEEAKNFINDMVIPDYNYWIGKEEYIERFMEVVEKKFA